MNSIINRIKERASKRNASVVLPETDDPRVLEAASQLLAEDICDVVLIGDADSLSQAIDEHQISLDINHADLTILSLQQQDLITEASDLLYDQRKHKGMAKEEAVGIMSEKLWLATALLGLGHVDGCVAGSRATTADVIRSGIYCLGLAEGVKTVSSTFLMAFQDGRTYTYADCGVVPYPDQKQLADITINASATHEALTEQESNVALLSFSTKGSAAHPSVELVQNALELVKKRAPNIKVDGELQFDAAYDPTIAKRKAPDSTVAGNANVFIFPNLDAGNIAYKITERLAGAQATGPILQGLSKPLMDLSRGCSPNDIVVAACVSILMGEK